MPTANVKTRWIDGDLVFYDKSGNEICRVDGTNRKLTLPAASDLDLTQALDGADLKNTAVAAVIGGIPVVHAINITAGTNGDTDVVLTHKTRVTNAWLVLTGAGVTSAVLTVKNGATAITDGMAASGVDKTVARAGTIDDAQADIAAAGTLRVTGSGGATQPAATVYVLGMRVA